MPLYELVMICRCTSAPNTANMLRTMSTTILQAGGNIRNMRVLGDRIMSKQLIGRDGTRHMIGRYVSIMYDGHPSYFKLINKTAQASFESLRTNHFKVKDFVSEAQTFTKPLEEEAPFIKSGKLESHEYERALEILREEKLKKEL